jgi:hypothetical protein
VFLEQPKVMTFILGFLTGIMLEIVFVFMYFYLIKQAIYKSLFIEQL